MTTDPITCVHIGRSTWQGPASAAPRKEDCMTHDPDDAERLEDTLRRITGIHKPAPQPVADEREAMVVVIRKACPEPWISNGGAEDIADALLAAGWTRKREEG